jgi:hypothetical protein
VNMRGRMVLWLAILFAAALCPVHVCALQTRPWAALRFLRDTGCDLSFFLMPLRAAPEGPRAILPIVLAFGPVLPKPTQPFEVVPCYRGVRK